MSRFSMHIFLFRHWFDNDGQQSGIALDSKDLMFDWDYDLIQVLGIRMDQDRLILGCVWLI
jgi:hypothetical protein